MTLPVVWRQSAQEDLKALIGFIAERNSHAARDLLQRINDGVVALGDSPCMGRSGRIAGTREMLVHPNYWAIYQGATDGIDVVGILHSRREYP